MLVKRANGVGWVIQMQTMHTDEAMIVGCMPDTINIKALALLKHIQSNN